MFLQKLNSKKLWEPCPSLRARAKSSMRALSSLNGDFHSCSQLSVRERNRGVTMLGAIIGDVAGSRFEWHNLKSKDFELFHQNCHITDDSVLTVAVASAPFTPSG